MAPSFSITPRHDHGWHQPANLSHCFRHHRAIMWRAWIWVQTFLVGNHVAQTFGMSMVLKVPANFPPVVILPGFGNDARDYANPIEGGEERAFTATLGRRGVDSFVVPVARSEWFKVARAVLTPEFWTSTCRPDGVAYAWYLRKVKETVASCREQTGSEKVLLMGHSAGGWLARAALGAGNWEEGIASEDIITGLVTLGTPHFVGPMDMTRGALAFTSEEYPGAFLKDRGISYVTVAGAAVDGDKDAPRNSKRRFAYGSYQTVCGEGATTGDACVPLASAHLEGALQITLDGVYHSVDTPDNWYGAEGVVDRWLESVVEELSPSPALKVSWSKALAGFFR